MFKCQFPNCTYTCEKRSQIENHHIIPQHQNGSHKKFNRIFLCPNCHTRVHTDDSIRLVGWRMSTEGMLLEYVENGETKYHNDH